MIQPNEYRIGNIVCWNPALTHPGTTIPKVYLEIASVAGDKIGYFSPGLEHRSEPFMDDLIQTDTAYKQVDELEPIPLTEQLLNVAIIPEMLTEDLAEKEIVFDAAQTSFTHAGKAVGGKVMYLHQLQNLYYALTGKDLQVNLKALPE